MLHAGHLELAAGHGQQPDGGATDRGLAGAGLADQPDAPHRDRCVERDLVDGPEHRLVAALGVLQDEVLGDQDRRRVLGAPGAAWFRDRDSLGLGPLATLGGVPKCGTEASSCWV